MSEEIAVPALVKADHEAHSEKNHPFEYKGFKCLVSRSPTEWNWNGYFNIPRDNKYHDHHDHHDQLEHEINIHGGITGGNSLNGMEYIGFDTMHADDIFVSSMSRFHCHKCNKFTMDDDKGDCADRYHPSYKSFNWVVAHLKEIVDQIINCTSADSSSEAETVPIA